MSARRRVLLWLLAGGAVTVLVAAVSIPSLLRARMTATRRDARMYALPSLAHPLPSAVSVGRSTAEDGTHGPPHDTEAYDRVAENPYLDPVGNPLSTFAVDVDTAAYANVRRFLREGRLPPADAVRIEELVNYFGYAYPEPEGDEPFSVSVEAAECPWKAPHRLVRIGLQGRRIPERDLPPRNLVFLVDVSGSMDHPLKLPLVKSALALLVERLHERDRVALAVYAGAAGLVLPSTSGGNKAAIREGLERLQAGGSTAGGDGIQLAYRVAREAFIEGGVNRVVLATDGDFNVGITSQGELLRLIERERQTGIALSVLGFGMGNLKDSTLEKLADHGNGNYAYIDTLSEARKVLVREGGGTLVTIAKDVKVQVEFNPRKVAAYRLIGYENRLLRAEDFGDDGKDGGEIGSGHSVTALYEVVPAGVEPPVRSVEPLRYQRPRPRSAEAAGEELLTIKLRYKRPDEDTSRLMTATLDDPGRRSPSGETAFAAAVAGFGLLLRDSEHKGQLSYGDVLALAQAATEGEPEGDRAEFVELVRSAQGMAATAVAQR